MAKFYTYHHRMLELEGSLEVKSFILQLSLHFTTKLVILQLKKIRVSLPAHSRNICSKVSVASRNFYQVKLSQERGGPASQQGLCVKRNRVIMMNYFKGSQARQCPQKNHLVNAPETILISTENKNKNYHYLSKYCVGGP